MALRIPAMRLRYPIFPDPPSAIQVLDVFFVGFGMVGRLLVPGRIVHRRRARRLGLEPRLQDVGTGASCRCWPSGGGTSRRRRCVVAGAVGRVTFCFHTIMGMGFSIGIAPAGVRPTLSEVITAAVSHDAGATRNVEQEGLHAPYCSAVAFAGDSVFVSASMDHSAEQAAIYRRKVEGRRPLVAVAGGLPAWIAGIADTLCIAVHGSGAALVDRHGNLYVSADRGRSWSRRAGGLPTPSSVLIV